MGKLSGRDLDIRYRDFLDEVYGVVSICGLEYTASRALKEVDPTAYRCGFNDWLDSETGETVFEHDGDYFDGPVEEEEEDGGSK